MAFVKWANRVEVAPWIAVVHVVTARVRLPRTATIAPPIAALVAETVLARREKIANHVRVIAARVVATGHAMPENRAQIAPRIVRVAAMAFAPAEKPVTAAPPIVIRRAATAYVNAVKPAVRVQAIAAARAAIRPAVMGNVAPIAERIRARVPAIAAWDVAETCYARRARIARIARPIARRCAAIICVNAASSEDRVPSIVTSRRARMHSAAQANHRAIARKIAPDRVA